MAFLDHLKETLEPETIVDLANYGADAGFGGLTYTSECVELYNEYEREIWDALNEDADSMGYENTMDMVRQFNRSDMLDDPDTFKNLLVWYMAEREARMFADEWDGEEE